MLAYFRYLSSSNRASTLAKSASTFSNRALIHDRNLLNSTSVVTANIMTSARVADFLASSDVSLYVDMDEHLHMLCSSCQAPALLTMASDSRAAAL